MVVILWCKDLHLHKKPVDVTTICRFDSRRYQYELDIIVCDNKVSLNVSETRGWSVIASTNYHIRHGITEIDFKVPLNTNTFISEIYIHYQRGVLDLNK